MFPHKLFLLLGLATKMMQFLTVQGPHDSPHMEATPGIKITLKFGPVRAELSVSAILGGGFLFAL